MRRMILGFLAAGILPGTPLADAGSTKRITEGHVDSKCIGNVSDPVCAIETWIACYALGRPELCALLGVEGMRFKPDAHSNIFDYRNIEVLPGTPDKIPLRLRIMSGHLPARLEVRVVKRSFNSDCKQCYEDSYQ